MPPKPRTSRPVEERLAPWGVAVFESYHAPEFFMEWRTHDFVKILFVVGGTGRLLTDDQAQAFGERDLILVPPGVRNRLVDDSQSPVELYLLCLSRSLLAFDPRVEGRLPLGVCRGARTSLSEIDGLFRRLLFQQRQPTVDTPLSMVTDALTLLQIAAGAAPPPSSDSPVGGDGRQAMAEYVAYLDTHFFEAPTIDEAAAQLGMSRRAFTERFREATGQSWLAYVRRRTIDHACRLLRDTDAPIALIAFECGFADLSTFYRQFKQVTGVAPGAWRMRRE